MELLQGKPTYKDAQRETLALLKIDGDLPLLEHIIPLITDADFFDPQKVNLTAEVSQFWWQRGELQGNDYERLCLTLSHQVVSLTVALDHRHSLDHLRSISADDTQLHRRSTLVITPETRNLYQSRYSMSEVTDTYYGEEAVDHFNPHLIHSLAAIGLHSARIDEQWAS